MLGVNADLAPLVVAAAGFLTGAVPGAVFGFGVGLFLDLAFAQTLGVSALVYVARRLRGRPRARAARARGADHAARARRGGDRVRDVRLHRDRVPLGDSAPISLLLVRDIVVTIALNSVIAVPVFAIVRRWLVPALPEDPRAGAAAAPTRPAG